MNKFLKVNLESERTIHFGEHETLMSFNNDEANYAFQDWWYRKGSELFNDWLKDSICWEHLAKREEE